MKKFFKLFAVALVAGCMFTACGDKETDPTNDPSNNPGDNQPTVAEGKILVNFGGNEWTSVAEGGVMAPSYNILGMSARSDEAGQTFPMADCYINQTTTGSWNDTYDTQAGGLGQWTGNQFSYIEYYEAGSVVDGNNTQYGDFWAESATVAVSQLDATALTFSMTCNATMFKAMDVFGQGGVGIANATKKQLTMTSNKLAFQIQ